MTADLLSQNVLQSSDARARQMPSESSSSFRLLPEPEPESSESRLLCGDLLRTESRWCKYWFLCHEDCGYYHRKAFLHQYLETEFPKDQKCVRKISLCEVAVSNKHEIAFFRRRKELPILFIIFAQWKKSIFCIIFWPKARDYSGEVLPDSEAVHVKNLLGEEKKLIVTLRVLQTLKIFPRSFPEGRVVTVDSLLDGRVDPGVVVLIELVGVGVSVRGPGHAHRAHHVTRDVRDSGPGSGLITFLTVWSIFLVTRSSQCHQWWILTLGHPHWPLLTGPCSLHNCLWHLVLVLVPCTPHCTPCTRLCSLFCTTVHLLYRTEAGLSI